MPAIFVVDLEEFAPVVEGCCKAGHTVTGPTAGYWTIESQSDITLVRKEMGLGPALWYTCLAGGIQGQLTDYGRETLTIKGAQ
ncbi:MAG: hypothetical protein Q7K57_32235 [Burkholderiaceae bacterium]|nr:hypothetical protein [Burkholderiaceae bacterium]